MAIKTSKNNINFDDKKLNKSTFHKNKKQFKIDDTDANKVLISKKESYSTKRLLKYFIEYNVNLPQMIDHVKHSESNKTIFFKVIFKNLLKNYIKIWERVSSLMNIELSTCL